MSDLISTITAEYPEALEAPQAAPAQEPYEFDQWGNKVWSFGGHAIRVDDSGPEPMFCRIDCCVVNGLDPKTGSRHAIGKEHQGVARFATPGGTQSLATISEEGFYTLTMRGNKPVSAEFREAMARVAKRMRKTGQPLPLSASPATPPQSLLDVVRQTLLAQQQAMTVSLQLVDQLAAHERQIAEARAVAAEAIARVDAMESRQEAATAELLALPAPTVAAPPETARRRLLAYVRAYCRSTGADYKAATNELYRQVKYRLGVDLRARLRNCLDKKKNMLDLLEESGRIEEAYAIACAIFPMGPLRVAE